MDASQLSFCAGYGGDYCSLAQPAKYDTEDSATDSSPQARARAKRIVPARQRPGFLGWSFFFRASRGGGARRGRRPFFRCHAISHGQTRPGQARSQDGRGRSHAIATTLSPWWVWLAGRGRDTPETVRDRHSSHRRCTCLAILISNPARAPDEMQAPIHGRLHLSHPCGRLHLSSGCDSTLYGTTNYTTTTTVVRTPMPRRTTCLVHHSRSVGRRRAISAGQGLRVGGGWAGRGSADVVVSRRWPAGTGVGPCQEDCKARRRCSCRDKASYSAQENRDAIWLHCPAPVNHQCVGPASAATTTPDSKQQVETREEELASARGAQRA